HNGHTPLLRPGPDCASFANLLPLLNVSALSEHDALHIREHLETCAYCRTQCATYGRIDVALRRYFGAPATPHLSAEAIMSITNEEQRHESVAPPTKTPTPSGERPPRRTQRIASIFSGIAAVLVMGALVTGIFASRGLLFKNNETPSPGAMTMQETPYVPGANDILTGVQALSSADVWAIGGAYKSVGGSGSFSALALHYSGGQWMRTAMPTDAQLGAHDVELESIAMVSPDEGWAVGFATNPGNGSTRSLPSGLILHYSDGQWSKVSEMPNTELWSVQMLSPTDGWLAGGGGWGTEQGATTSILLHYTGGKWVFVRAPNVAGIHSLAMVSPTDGWATGQGTIMRYDGSHWSAFSRLQGVAGVSMDSATDGWAFGGELFPNNPTSAYSTVWHYSGSQWTQGTLPSAVVHDSQITALSMDSTSDGWAVGVLGGLKKGASSQTLYLHYTNGQWTQVQGPNTGPLNAISMISSQDGWAVGVDGTLLHYQNGVWARMN
ncbi:MAG TPA: hypothetical protein VKQ36_11690, partial [Ktedonobacterales bacterium]|nr:hypothetical protein [Ktedonobacterales bacterium]